MSQETQDLKELLDACDTALRDCSQVVEGQDGVIKIQEGIIQDQAKRVGELEASRSDIMNNKLVWLAIGVVLGGVTFSLLK